MWAYIWLYICLEVSSLEEVTLMEGWLTLFFCLVLIVVAYSADKLNAYWEEKKKTNAQLEEADLQKEINIKKQALRSISKEKGESCLLEIA